MSDFMEIDDLSDLANKLIQNADNLEVTQNIPMTNETFELETPTIESNFNTEGPNDT